MPSYKLIYFNGRGRAEACRLMFALAGQAFEDKRVDGEEWKKIRPDIKFGQLPVMEIDGKQFAQSRALLTFLAREFGYYGKTSLDALAIDEILSIVEDFIQAVIKVKFAPEDKKEENAKDFKENQVPKFMGWLEKLLKANPSGYFVGNSVTVADVAVFDLITSMCSFEPDACNGFPLVKGLVEKIGGIGKIKEWVAKRPVTQF